MKKVLIISSVVLILGIAAIMPINYFLYGDYLYFMRPKIDVENLVVNSDMDKDGISDLDDILEGARKEIRNHPKYKSEYYSGGYPPQTEGVCTDVVWRALKNAGYDLKSNIDKDIKQNLQDYSGSVANPDPNIDFRRVKNQYVFFKKYAMNLTTEVIPYDKSNLVQWQRGDIVVLPQHVAIISDKRGKNGVPYIIHNASTYPKEENHLLNWYNSQNIIGHFRFCDSEARH
ncbi:DUF1287 domain-containing protein [Acetivibrio cellulolyticus]|uniref:DUF1287 domain-containing protein n=1 Tax=Acetivibrio cellulolyticus TaxID=35830 RepID=UPI0001E2E737|nr:DUF1287 domain-containing protein [Acetivibrio cellulolyticus]